ncbi:hypothetical protein KA057_00780 [Candidatus Gracilibacteria bacterium]|nr:hypothetical protein [Candidatus Gracilibacteria bacterium]
MPTKEKANQKVRECVGITLESNEELFMVVRKHWIILVETFIFLAMLTGMCVGIYFICAFAGVPTIFTILTLIGVCMISLQYIFVHWVNNELDLLIITNRRIISYDQIRFLDRKMSQTTIDLVQEVNSSTSGLLGNILHYGNLMIKTASDSAGDVSDFNMTHIPEPINTSRLIHSFIDEYRHSLDSNENEGLK